MDWKSTRRDRVLPPTILRHFGVRGPPVWPDDIAKALGVAVHPVPNFPGWSGAVRFDGNAARIWYYQHDSGAERDNFFIALELGRIHHCPTGQFTDRDLQIGDLSKRDAYRWAEALLMPANWIRHFGPGAGYDIEVLANLFMVEPTIMAARIQRLSRRKQL